MTDNEATATDLLSTELQSQVDKYAQRRRRDKKKAFWLRMGAVMLSAAVTVLIGLRVDSALEPTLKNTALFLSATVGILNAWEAFYDHRALWVKRTATVARLSTLQRRFNLARAMSNGGALQSDVANAIYSELEDILGDDLSSWVQMRKTTEVKQAPSDGQ